MKNLKFLKLNSFIIVVLFVCQPILCQDTYFQDESEDIETLSRILTEKYQPELVMSSDQTLLFEKKISEFLIREKEIKTRQSLSVRQKMRLLKRLSRQETAEMGNILTRPQLRRYKKVKRRIQPVMITVGTTGNQG